MVRSEYSEFLCRLGGSTEIQQMCKVVPSIGITYEHIEERRTWVDSVYILWREQSWKVNSKAFAQTKQLKAGPPVLLSNRHLGVNPFLQPAKDIPLVKPSIWLQIIDIEKLTPLVYCMCFITAV